MKEIKRFELPDKSNNTAIRAVPALVDKVNEIIEELRVLRGQIDSSAMITTGSGIRLERIETALEQAGVKLGG